MDANRYRQTKELFNRASEISVGERDNFLRNACEDSELRSAVEKMLAVSDEPDDELEKGAFDVFTNGQHNKIPENIGGYTILREIGRGGMGAVYEAVRETSDFKRRVAVKVIKRGMDTDAIVSRFRHEQKILASLEHPFIARFLDGGMTDYGLPFYAMEFVEGDAIDDYCLEKKLTIVERLKLFREVCTALQYAHQNLVIHRDLKPKNILVTREGTPKLLDFGIGKILTPDAEEEIGTATQLGMMTPAYASPEQIRGARIGTASDVYSLGVILYELLTGRKPYKLETRSQFEIEKAVLETEPVKPSSVASSDIKKLKGDLDNIVLKALSKDVADRYVSVGQLSEDIRRYLEGAPILARPHTFSYRFGKFIKRNRVGAATTVVIFLTLIGGITATGWQAYRAESQRALAEKRFAEVRTIANKVVFKYHDEIEKLTGSTAVREMLVSDATVYLDNLAKDSGDDSELERELALAYLKLGDVQGKMYAANTGNTAGAMASYEKAVRLLEKVAADRPEDISVKDDFIKANDSLVFLMARTTLKDGDKIAMLDRSARMIEQILQIEPKNAKRLTQLAGLYIRYGDSVGRVDVRPGLLKKLAYHEKALSFGEELVALEPDTPESLKTLMRINQRLGSDHLWLGENAEITGDVAQAPPHFADALPFHEKMFAIARRLAGISPNDPETRRNLLAAHLSYAGTLNRNGRHDEALVLAGKALELARQTQLADQGNREAKFDVAESYRLTAAILAKTRQIEAVVENLNKAIEICEEMSVADINNNESRSLAIENLTALRKVYEDSGDQNRASETARRITEFSERSKIPGRR